MILQLEGIHPSGLHHLKESVVGALEFTKSAVVKHNYFNCTHIQNLVIPLPHRILLKSYRDFLSIFFFFFLCLSLKACPSPEAFIENYQAFSVSLCEHLFWLRVTRAYSNPCKSPCGEYAQRRERRPLSSQRQGTFSSTQSWDFCEGEHLAVKSFNYSPPIRAAIYSPSRNVCAETKPSLG